MMFVAATTVTLLVVAAGAWYAFSQTHDGILHSPAKSPVYRSREREGPSTPLLTYFGLSVAAVVGGLLLLCIAGYAYLSVYCNTPGHYCVP